ncbi:MAG: class I SAM-dependent methyltransferase [Burkholderiales bacterium]|jgi:SAM-dependent methyltransferase|nr:class I SAM-dependent methyltransferase [Burkholderiales bacterium]
MSTDTEWEKWGRQDPYFGVITADRFRSNRLNDEALAEFFASGEHHVDGVLRSCRTYFGGEFAPKRILDFGCGVGRLVIAFAQKSEEVVGVDISDSMLSEAARNCAERGLVNVALVRSDDQLSQVRGKFDLIHSAITLQHIDVARGRQIIQRLLRLVATDGAVALHLTYAKRVHASTFGRLPPSSTPRPPPPSQSVWKQLFKRRTETGNAPGADASAVDRGDPQMLMNSYDLNEISFILQEAGVTQMHAEFTDHGGELGVFIFFRRPAST